MIVEFSKLQKQRDYKQSVVMSFLINYYKDMADSSGVDIPYFVRANDTYNEIIKSCKDLNKYYYRIMEKRKCF